MDKEKYYKMCEDMGSDPVDDQIPKDYSDFTTTTQEVYDIFITLPDITNAMSGQYMGKDLSNIFTLFKIYNISENNWLLYLELIRYIVDEYTKAINEKAEREAKAIEAKNKNGNKGNNKRI